MSSFRGNSTVQQVKLLEEIVHDLIKHDDAWPFLKPVSKKDVSKYVYGQSLRYLHLFVGALT